LLPLSKALKCPLAKALYGKRKQACALQGLRHPITYLPVLRQPEVLIYPTVLDDAVMYIMVSDNADAAKVDLRDKLTGARQTLQLAGQHAAIAVIGNKEKAVVAKYGY
jgi:hypothetical protein